MSASSPSGESGRLAFGGAPARLDAWLAAARPDHSRARWQDLIREQRVRVNGLPRKPDLVLVGLGGNDMLRGLSPQATRTNIDAILTELGGFCAEITYFHAIKAI